MGTHCRRSGAPLGDRGIGSVIALPLTVQQHSDGTIKHPPSGGVRSVLSSSMPERRAIPFALLGLLSLLAVAAAVVGIRVESSTGQLALEAAFQKTSEAASFSYVISRAPRLDLRVSSLGTFWHGEHGSRRIA